MAEKSKEETRKTKLQESDYGAEMVRALHSAMRLVHFSADDIWNFATENGVPEEEIARLSGALLKQYKAAMYVRLTRKFVVSRRTSRPLPLWTVSRKIRKATGLQ